MYLDFEKWHGCENDFIIVRVLGNDDVVLNSIKKHSQAWCRRSGTGVGADGVIALHLNTSKDMIPERITIVNSDGSLAEICGNGIRCVALSVLRHFRIEQKLKELPEAIEFQSGGRTISCSFLGQNKMSERDSTWPFVSVNMGKVKLNEDAPVYAKAKAAITRVAAELNLPQLTKEFGVCDIGNQHLVFFLPDVTRELLHKVGPAFQNCPEWDGINVHLVTDDELDSRQQTTYANLLGEKPGEGYRAMTWERGAGPTAACGSGACAVAVCAMEAGHVSRRKWCLVGMPGGHLFVKQDDVAEDVTLAGPATLVYTGKIEL